MRPIILGLYGLSKNHKGTSGYEVVKNNDAINILKTAWGRGIRFLDTAPSYGKGNADFLIKELRKLNYDFKLISKLGLDIQSNKFCEDHDLIKKERDETEFELREKIANMSVDLNSDAEHESKKDNDDSTDDDSHNDVSIDILERR